MKNIVVGAHNIISPLGFTSEENYLHCRAGISGIKQTISPTPPHDALWLSQIDDNALDKNFSSLQKEQPFTKVEKLLLLSIHKTLTQTSVSPDDPDLLIIISTTKGNIDLLEEKNKHRFPPDRVQLWSLSDTVQHYFNTAHKPVVLSNACISGVNAILLASRFIQDGLYKKVLVVGVDIASRFVISGFQSFKAISAKPCRPFDLERDGINLGEGCASILLTTETAHTDHSIKMLGGAISNDANHISGPSRSGDGLYLAISHALKDSALRADQIDLLNAHGTATVYNDEMESKAFKLAGLQETSLNGLKGYFGHTLGAAGVIETILSILSMQKNEILPTLGYQHPGTPENVNISNTLQHKEIKYLLKTASGFGGCNGAIIFEKNV